MVLLNLIPLYLPCSHTGECNIMYTDYENEPLLGCPLISWINRLEDDRVSWNYQAELSCNLIVVPVWIEFNLLFLKNLHFPIKPGSTETNRMWKLIDWCWAKDKWQDEWIKRPPPHVFCILFSPPYSAPSRTCLCLLFGEDWHTKIENGTHTGIQAATRQWMTTQRGWWKALLESVSTLESFGGNGGVWWWWSFYEVFRKKNVV